MPKKKVTFRLNQKDIDFLNDWVQKDKDLENKTEAIDYMIKEFRDMMQKDGVCMLFILNGIPCSDEEYSLRTRKQDAEEENKP